MCSFISHDPALLPRFVQGLPPSFFCGFLPVLFLEFRPHILHWVLSRFFQGSSVILFRIALEFLYRFIPGFHPARFKIFLPRFIWKFFLMIFPGILSGFIQGIPFLILMGFYQRLLPRFFHRFLQNFFNDCSWVAFRNYLNILSWIVPEVPSGIYSAFPFPRGISLVISSNNLYQQENFLLFEEIMRRRSATDFSR